MELNVNREKDQRLARFCSSSACDRAAEHAAALLCVSFCRSAKRIGYETEAAVAQPCPTLCDPMSCSPWDSPAQNTGVGSGLFSQGASQPRDRTRALALQGGSYQLSPQGGPSAHI